MRKFAIMLLVALASMGCGGSDSPTSPPPASVAGTWNLQTINGQNLPYITAQTGANKTEITGDVLTVSGSGSGSGSFTELSSYRITTNGQVTTQSGADAGTFTVNGTAVAFQFNSNGSIGTGTLSGTTLTVAESGVSLVYKKG